MVNRRAASESTNRRSAYRQKLDLPIEVKVLGLHGAPTKPATLVDLSATGCRIRSRETYDMGTRVGFHWKGMSGAMRIGGRIIKREKTVSSFIYDYGIAFASMTPDEEDNIFQELLSFQRRDAVANAEKKTAVGVAADELPQTRLSYRESVTFPVRYATGNQHDCEGEASDISMDGIRLWTNVALQSGARLHLTFTLPDFVLSVDSPEAIKRRSEFSRKNERFTEIRTKGLVVARLQGQGKGMPHGVRFVDLHPADREELARFIHSLQIYRLAERRAESKK